jgi:hypothetical protein
MQQQIMMRRLLLWLAKPNPRTRYYCCCLCNGYNKLEMPCKVIPCSLQGACNRFHKHTEVVHIPSYSVAAHVFRPTLNKHPVAIRLYLGIQFPLPASMFQFPCFARQIVLTAECVIPVIPESSHMCVASMISRAGDQQYSLFSRWYFTHWSPRRPGGFWL